MKWWKKYWDKVVIGAMVMIFIMMSLKSISDCDGTIVRGVFWFECIKG